MKSKIYSDRITAYLHKQFSLPEEQVASMLPDFARTLRSHMQNLDEVSQEKNLQILAKAAHTIKGALLNLGLSDCADLALQIEEGCNNCNAEVDYGALVGKLRLKVYDIVGE